MGCRKVIGDGGALSCSPISFIYVCHSSEGAGSQCSTNETLARRSGRFGT